MCGQLYPSENGLVYKVVSSPTVLEFGLYSLYPPALENEDKQLDIPGFIGRLLCNLGFHDFAVVEVTLGFGAAGGVQKSECRRCGAIKSQFA